MLLRRPILLDKSNCERDRGGAALVEFAVCLPVVLLILLTGMDAIQLIRTRQATVEVVHETARIVAVSDIDEKQAREFAEERLAAKRLMNPRIVFTPPPDNRLKRGSLVTVRIDVPTNGNCMGLSSLFRDSVLRAQTTVSREIGQLPNDPAEGVEEPRKGRRGYRKSGRH